MHVKDVELKLISELMKNSRKSDRELARILNVSQPTVTRARTRLENTGFIREYTLIPNFQKLGFHLVAMSFVQLPGSLTQEETEHVRKSGRGIALESFPEVIVAERGRGCGYQAVFVSFHKNYQAYVDYVDRLKRMKLLGNQDFESFLISLDDKIQYRYLTLSTLATTLMQLREEQEE
jgi:DNA-binding Lrp family transcriptional regulator